MASGCREVHLRKDAIFRPVCVRNKVSTGTHERHKHGVGTNADLPTYVVSRKGLRGLQLLFINWTFKQFKAT